jgi:hypothetical protein
VNLPEPASLTPWTRITGTPPSTGAEFVVLVPPDAPPEAAVPAAWRLVDAGERVRIIGRGVTADSFLETLPSRGGALLTELDAYLPTDKRPLQRELEEGLARWLEAVFHDAVPGVRARDAFWASAVTRLGLQDIFDAWCYARGLVRHHGGAYFLVTEDRWAGGPMLADLLPRAEQVAGVSRKPTRPLDRLKLGLFGGAASVISVLMRGREFFQEAPTRRYLDSQKPDEVPQVWLGINGAWEFSSRHVLGPLGAHARKHGVRLGVLLQSTLKPGTVRNAHRVAAPDRALLPALFSESLQGTVARVAQTISYGTWAELLSSLPGTWFAMLRCSARVATSAAEIDFGPFRLAVAAAPGSTLRLTTLDVLRGREAAAATRRFLQSTPLVNARIALSQASLVADAVPDLLMQTAGATTYDVVHGALAEPLDMIASARTNSTHKLLWTESEARYLEGHIPNACRGALPPRTWTVRGRSAPQEPLRVLVLSNYCTLVGGGHRRRLPRLGYQELLLSDVKALLERAQKPIHLRWRPHPGDDRAQIRLACFKFGNALVLSNSKHLEEDLEWADLFISSLSSTVVEALAWEKPLLLHDVPIHEADVLMSLFDPARRFRNGAELLRTFMHATAQLASGAPLVEEQTLRREFFGPCGVPGSIAEVIFPR